MNSKRMTLGECISLCIDHRGKTPKKLGSDWSSTGYRALSAKNVKTGKIVQEDTIRFVDENLYRKWMPDEIRRGDILVTSEAPFGQIFLWDTDEKIVLSQRLFGIRPNPVICNPGYLYYWMIGHQFQEEMRGRATGTTVIGLRQPELLKCSVQLPSLDKQAAISACLRTIDEKIDINARLNDYLAQLCEAIAEKYCEAGEVRLGDICHQVTDKANCEDAKLETYVSTESLLQNKQGRQQASSLPTTGKVTLYAAGDTLVSNIRPYFKKVWYAPFDGTCSGDVLVFRANEAEDAPYLHACLRQDRFFDHVMRGAKGTKMPRGDKKQMMEFCVSSTCGADDLSLMKAALNQIAANDAESANLEDLRDTLLPKLMSGEIDVSKVDLTQLNSHLA